MKPLLVPPKVIPFFFTCRPIFHTEPDDLDPALRDSPYDACLALLFSRMLCPTPACHRSMAGLILYTSVRSCLSDDCVGIPHLEGRAFVMAVFSPERRFLNRVESCFAACLLCVPASAAIVAGCDLTLTVVLQDVCSVCALPWKVVSGQHS